MHQSISIIFINNAISRRLLYYALYAYMLIIILEWLYLFMNSSPRYVGNNTTGQIICYFGIWMWNIRGSCWILYLDCFFLLMRGVRKWGKIKYYYVLMFCKIDQFEMPISFGPWKGPWRYMDEQIITKKLSGDCPNHSFCKHNLTQ